MAVVKVSSDKKISLDYLANQTAPAFMEGLREIKTGLTRIKATATLK